MHSIFGQIYIKVKFFNIFVANELFKSFFNKRDVTRYYYFNNMY